MLAFMFFMSEALLAIILAFIVGYFCPTAWAEAKQDRYNSGWIIVVVVPLWIRVTHVMFYIGMMITVIWWLHPIIQAQYVPGMYPPDEIGLAYLFGPLLPLVFHFVVARTVMRWANELSVQMLDDDEISLFNGLILDTSRVSVVRRTR